MLRRAFTFVILAALLVMSRSSERQDRAFQVPAFASFRHAGQIAPAACVQVWRCMAQYIKPTLTPDDIRLFLAEGMNCFADDENELEKQSVCLPLRLGVDSYNRRPLGVSYTCSDVCPRYGRIQLTYAHVPEKDCCALGGYPLIDSAFGAYTGCAPPEAFAGFRGVRRTSTASGGLVSLCAPGECVSAACAYAAEMAEEEASEAALLRALMQPHPTEAVTPAR